MKLFKKRSKVFKLAFFIILLLVEAVQIKDTKAQGQGEAIFKKACIACHTIGRGKLVGPDLNGVTESREEEWMIRFIKSSQTMIKEGDSIAVSNFNEFNKLIMPDQPLNNNEIKAVIDYIKSESKLDLPLNQSNQKSILADITQEEIQRGKELFEGTRRLTNGGTACIACHAINSNAVFPGGKLAKNLTGLSKRMNDRAIKAIVSTPPFPAMIESYSNNSLTEQEQKELIGFLLMADLDKSEQAYAGFEWTFFFAVLICLILLLLVYFLMWIRTKKYSVSLFMSNSK